MTQLTLRSPAKINLGLEVGGRRPDGFHEIVTIIVPLELSDRVTIHCARTGIGVTTDSEHVPDGPENLAFQAAAQFTEAAGIKTGCRIRIRKLVPVGAGLGGGSSNAATVLLGLNRMYGQPLSTRRLHRIALTLGSDVPAFLLQCPCVARGRGEKLRPIRLPVLHILLYLPGYPVSTRWAYAELDRFRASSPSLTSPGLSPKILGFKLRQGELTGVADRVCNSFEPVVFRHHPDLARARELLLEHGAFAAALSGSGSTVYGLMDDEGSQDPMAEMARHGFPCVRTHSIQAL